MKQKEYTDEELYEMVEKEDIRIRKLTPREIFRLMGVREYNIDKIQAANISKTQQYKMAGNSICVDNMYYLFLNLFINKESSPKRGDQMKLF